jgi:MoxR-like ATPase
MIESALASVHSVIAGQEEPIRLLLIALTARGHALLEGVPGVGKTTLAKTFARTAGLEFSRIQLTPDLMPADIVGHSYFDQKAGDFKIRKGPVFAHVLLADEINRAPPRTQSALLEVMEEHHVTIEGQTMPVPQPFLVLATKNPIDIEGVYPLPEAQLDRFMLFIDMDYPDLDVERDILMRKLTTSKPTESIEGLAAALHDAHERVHVDRDVLDYALAITRATRVHPAIELGVGPRGSEHLVSAARASAVLAGREYVIPDDIKHLAVPVLAHRLMLAPDAEVEGLEARDLLREILDATPVPIGKVAHAAD